MRHRELRMEDMCFRKGQLSGNSLLVASALCIRCPPSKPTWNCSTKYLKMYFVWNFKGIYQKKSSGFQWSYLVQSKFCALKGYFLCTMTGYWFQRFFTFTSTRENDPIWLLFFKWVEYTLLDLSSGNIFWPQKNRLLPPILETTHPSTFLSGCLSWFRFRVSINHPLGV